MSIRKFDSSKDLEMIKGWWAGHGAHPCPDQFLPHDGFVISDGGVDIAVNFLYMANGGKLAMTEYMTTNPDKTISGRTKLRSVKALIAHVENFAREAGCTGMISMVAPGTGEDRMMRRLDYLPPDGPSHIMFCKRLIKN